MCAECNKKTEPTARKDHVRDQLQKQIPELAEYNSLENARLALESFFPIKKRRFLDILLQRYYNGTTLNQIGQRLGCTREYVRQCQEKAVKIILKAVPHDNLLDNDEEDGLG